MTDRFPGLNSIPRASLVQAPTPVEPLPELGRSVGYQDLWIKRDDLSGTPYGGNKPRKLEYAFGDMLDKGVRAVVTVGGIGTNHGLATAIHAQRLGLACHLVLVEQPVTEHVLENMRLFHSFGASLYLSSSFAGAGSKAARLLARGRLGLGEGKTALLGPGGSSPLTGLGFVNAAFELKAQIDAKQIAEPACIICPTGTGGTLAGLLLGCRLCGLSTRVLGVQVVDPLFTGPKRIVSLANGTLRLIKRHQASVKLAPLTRGQVRIIEGYLGECYGAVTPESQQAVRLAAEHGIALETTYSGKAFAALTDFAKTLPAGSGPLLFWNTFNSRDLSQRAAKVHHRDLPPAFHRFFEAKA